ATASEAESGVVRSAATPGSAVRTRVNRVKAIPAQRGLPCIGFPSKNLLRAVGEPADQRPAGTSSMVATRATFVNAKRYRHDRGVPPRFPRCIMAGMVELTCDNLLDYLRAQGHLGAGPAAVESLGGGVSNAVLRVVTPERVFVVKQSRPQLRTRDAWFSDLGRVYREEEVMRMLHPLLPPHTVPEVLFSDRANYVFAMSHAPSGARVWKEALLAASVDLALGERAGVILGRIHETTARDTALVEPFRDHTVFVQLRVDPFYRRV